MLSDLVVASAHRSAEASVRSIGMSIARVVCPVHLQLLSFPAYRGAGSRLNPGSSRGITVVEAGLLPSPALPHFRCGKGRVGASSAPEEPALSVAAQECELRDCGTSILWRHQPNIVGVHD